MTNRDQLDPRAAAPPWRMGLAVILLALLIRAFLCSQLDCISRDGVHFVTFAKQLADDPIAAMKANTKQPGFAWLLLGTHRLVGPLFGGDTPLSWERCGQLLALLGGVAVCGLIYALAWRLFDGTVAAVAGILAAFWWQGAQLSADVLSDMPHLALYLAAWLLAYSALFGRSLALPRRLGRSLALPSSGRAHGLASHGLQEKSHGLAEPGRDGPVPWAVRPFERDGGSTGEGTTARPEGRGSGELPTIALCGIVAGLAYLLRQEALGLVAAVGLCTLWPSPGVSLRRRLVAVVILGACFTAVIAPQALAVGQIMPNKNLRDFLFGWPRASQAAAPAISATTVKELRAAPAKVAARAFARPREGAGRYSERLVRPSKPPLPYGRGSDSAERKDRSLTVAARYGRGSAPEKAIAAQAAGGRPSPLLAHLMPWWEAPLGMLEAWAKSGRYAISTLVLIGVFWKQAPRAERCGRRLVLAAILLQLALVQLRVATYGEISSRYLVIPAALGIPWAASGLVALLNAVIDRLRSAGNAAKSLVLTAGFVLPLAPQAYYFLRPASHAGRYLRDAGAWLAKDAKPDEIVLAPERLEQMMFYADRTYPHDGAWLRIPRTATADDLCGLLDRSRPAWFIDAEAYRPAPAAGAATRPAQEAQFDDGSFLEALERRANVSLLPTRLLGPPGQRVCLVRVGR